MHWLERHWYRITFLHLVLLPISMIFLLLATLRRMLYRSGVLHAEKLPVPVIVVGNISIGGSGKTPLTIWLARQLIDKGWHPGIISRGYAGNSASPQAVLSTGDPAVAGDEAVLMAQRDLCPVWVGRDRVAAGRALLASHPECDVLLSDDGLQHYRLRRDFEIAVVDGVRRFGNGFVLPAGPLRELPSRLKEADAVVVNGGATRGNELRMTMEGSDFYNLLNPDKIRPSGFFQNLRLHAIAGIGHPQRFFSHLNALGLKAQTHAFADHHCYTAGDLNFTDAEAILMTEKDAVKCVRFATGKYWALHVDAQVDPALARHIMERIARNGRQTA